MYPCIQILLFFVGSYFVLIGNFMMAGLSIGLASLFLSFSLHITYHYHVHHKPKSKTLDTLINHVISLLLGLPFQFYQIQHFVHHKYDNSLEDFTTTYKLENGRRIGKSVWKYSLLWFLQIQGRSSFVKQTTKLGFMNPKVRMKMRLEGLLTLLILIVTAWYEIKLVIGYVLMIYLGWTFIALHNYGQHLPEDRADKIGYSYYGRIYNKLFLNNGLHFEHHEKPGIKYWDLQENRTDAGINTRIHLIDPLFKKNQRV